MGFLSTVGKFGRAALAGTNPLLAAGLVGGGALINHLTRRRGEEGQAPGADRRREIIEMLMADFTADPTETASFRAGRRVLADDDRDAARRDRADLVASGQGVGSEGDVALTAQRARTRGRGLLGLLRQSEQGRRADVGQVGALLGAEDSLFLEGRRRRDRRRGQTLGALSGAATGLGTFLANRN